MSPELVEVTRVRCTHVQVAAAVRRGHHGCVSGAVGDRDEGGAGAWVLRSGSGEQKQLSEKPTQNLAAYDAYLKGEESLERRMPRSSQRAQGAGFLRAGRGAGSRLRASVGESLRGEFEPVLRQHADTPAGRACPAGGGKGRRARAEPAGGISGPRDLPRDRFSGLHPRPGAVREGPPRRSRGCLPLRAAAYVEQGLGRWDAAVEHSRQAERLDPRSVNGLRPSATHSSVCGAIPRRGRLLTVASPSRLLNLDLIERRP